MQCTTMVWMSCFQGASNDEEVEGITGSSINACTPTVLAAGRPSCHACWTPRSWLSTLHMDTGHCRRKGNMTLFQMNNVKQRKIQLQMQNGF